ncbi:MAG: hypothetical protein AAGF74_10945 [Pseudomonadota bacterium]
MAAKGDADDPKGLIRESYNIDGISPEECRSIFVDWALSIPVEIDTQVAIGTLLSRYGTDAPDHPMTGVLREGLTPGPAKGRRGGRAARVPPSDGEA